MMSGLLAFRPNQTDMILLDGPLFAPIGLDFERPYAVR
jgi:hypothetical protein